MADMAMAEAAPGVMPRVGRPKGIQYRNVAPFGLRAISRQIKFYPTQSGSYSYSGQNTIQIPIVGSTGFLDAQNSFVHFRITNTSRCGTAAGVDQSGAAVMIDQSAYSLFNRYRVIGSMGDEVERIDRFNKLMSVLLDYNMTPTHRATMASQVAGTNSSLVGLQGNAQSVAQGNAGIAIGAGKSVEICLPIATGLFAQDKYIPLGLVRGAGLRLEFLLEDPELCLMQLVNATNTATTGAGLTGLPSATNSYPLSNGYTIDQVYYTGRVIEFEGINMNERLVADMQSTGRPLVMRGVSFDYASTSASGVVGDDQHLFNLRARSVKAIMSFPDVADNVYEITRGLYGQGSSAVDHPSGDAAAVEYAAGTLINFVGNTSFTAAQLRRLFPSISCRPSYNVSRYQYTVGNLQMPPQFIEANAVRAYGEPISNSLLAANQSNANAQQVWEFPQSLESTQETFNRFNDAATATSVVRQNAAVSYGMLAPKLTAIDSSIGIDLADTTFKTAANALVNVRYLSADVVSKFLMAINTDSYLHDQSVVDSGFDTASQGLSIVLRTTTAARPSSGVISRILALGVLPPVVSDISGNFSYTMLHYTMNEVFYEIDLNGQVIKAQ